MQSVLYLTDFDLVYLLHSVEMDWWQEIQHRSRPDITIACVPAMVRDKKKGGVLGCQGLFTHHLTFSIGVDQEHPSRRMGHYGAAM